MSDAGCPWQEYLLHEKWVVRGLQEVFEDDYDSSRKIIQFSSTLACLEYNPRHDILILLMRMLGIIAYIMRFAVGGAIETVALASDVAICHRTILQAGNIRCQFLAVHHQTAQIFVGAGVVGTSGVTDTGTPIL